MNHEIITFCSENYKPCLDKFVHSWKKQADKVTIYTDTPNFGEQIFDDHFEEWKINTHRKILTIEYALHNSKAKYITYLDSDCYVVDNFMEVYKTPYDINVTRIVHRKDRPNGEKAINAGVIFLKNNKKVKLLLEEWNSLAESLFEKERYHEQTALSDLCYDAFDGLKPYTCGVLSERVYNCEHDEKDKFRAIIKKYNPKIIHFKNSWWQDDKLLADYIS